MVLARKPLVKGNFILTFNLFAQLFFTYLLCLLTAHTPQKYFTTIANVFIYSTIALIAFIFIYVLA